MVKKPLDLDHILESMIKRLGYRFVALMDAYISEEVMGDMDGLKLEIRNLGKTKQKHEGQISNFQFQRSVNDVIHKQVLSRSKS
jgi:hypothetical protein